MRATTVESDLECVSRGICRLEDIELRVMMRPSWMDWVPSVSRNRRRAGTSLSLRGVRYPRSDGDNQHYGSGSASAAQGLLSEAFIDTDARSRRLWRNAKAGWALSYKGIWGLPRWWSRWLTPRNALSGQPSGQRRQSPGLRAWIDRAIKLVAQYAGKITLRGDTDFTLTGELDAGMSKESNYFRMDAYPRW